MSHISDEKYIYLNLNWEEFRLDENILEQITYFPSQQVCVIQIDFRCLTLLQREK